jgi:hypothetical protein
MIFGKLASLVDVVDRVNNSLRSYWRQWNSSLVRFCNCIFNSQIARRIANQNAVSRWVVGHYHPCYIFDTALLKILAVLVEKSWHGSCCNR